MIVIVFYFFQVWWQSLRPVGQNPISFIIFANQIWSDPPEFLVGGLRNSGSVFNSSFLLENLFCSMADEFQVRLLFKSLEKLRNLDRVNSNSHDDPFSILQIRHIVCVFERLSSPPFAFAIMWSCVNRTSPFSLSPQRFK